jgi:serine protease Do
MSNRFFQGRPWLATLTLTAALGATAIFGLTAATSGLHTAASVKTALRSEAASGRGYSGVVKKVLPAVVNISTSKVVKTQMRGQGNSQEEDLFRQFFGDRSGGRGQQPMPRDRREKATGSGVIVSPEGYVLTNNHVVDGATEVVVTLHDKREFQAKVIGTDPRTDIAVLKLEGSNFPSLTLADSSKVEVGDVVLAIGNPFGVGQTVTMGIVSATGRAGLGIEEVEDFIQTDAAINPGNSGGALVDDEGHLVGINTAILAGNSGGNQGIGFAVPINMARHDMDQIIAHGKVERGYLGILPQDVTPAIARAFNTETTGALVGDVTAGGPASKSDLHKGDIIRSLNGQEIANANQLRLAVGMMAPGTTLKMNVLRDGKPMTVSMTLGEFPSNEERASIEKETPDNSALEGVRVSNLTPDVAQELKLGPQTKGVVVEDVSASSRAADSGLHRGDVIQEVNHQPVKSVQEFTQTVRSTKTGAPVLLLVSRQGNTLFLAV